MKAMRNVLAIMAIGLGLVLGVTASAGAQQYPPPVPPTSAPTSTTTTAPTTTTTAQGATTTTEQGATTTTAATGPTTTQDVGAGGLGRPGGSGGAGAGQIPRTGNDSFGMFQVGVVMISIGGLAAYAARRRITRHASAARTA